MRHYESELLKKKRLDQALELDCIASYGRANVEFASGGFQPALAKYRNDLKKIADVWSDIIENKPNKFGQFIEGNPRSKLQKVKEFIDEQKNKYKEFETEGRRRNTEWHTN